MLRRWISDPRPIVVGGTGGSGTRVVQAVLARAGAFMGVRLNGSGDAMDFEPFLDDSINRVLVVTRSLDYSLEALPVTLRRELLRKLDQIVAHYRGEQPIGTRWGWKNGRSMYLLPLIHTRFPEMTFLHVLRDGRDMALSGNRNQLRKHYEALFGESASESDAEAALKLWSTTNRSAAEWGRRMLGTRYIPIRFEDLCAEPADFCAALAHRLGLPITVGDLLATSVVPPPTIGRWRRADAIAVTRPPAADKAALATFGYC